MPTFQQLPSGSWRASVRLAGHEPQYKTFKQRSDAESWAASAETSLRKISLTALIDGETDALTFAQAYALYLESPAFLKKAATTRRREPQCAVAPLRLLGKTALIHISAPLLQSKFFDVRASEKGPRGQTLSGDTLRLEKALISSVFAFARRRGHVKINPTLAGDFELPTLGTRDIRISHQEEVLLTDTALEYINHYRANRTLPFWLAFVFATGTRPGEAAKIERSWCNFRTNQIHIPRTGHKTRLPRVILIPENIVEFIKVQDVIARHAESKYLFFSGKEGDYKPYRYSHPWRKICRRVGIPDSVVPHGIRHEYISRLFQYTTLSDTQVAALVGDVHVLSLRPYTHLRAVNLKPQLEAHAQQISELRKQAHSELLAKGQVVPGVLELEPWEPD